MQKSTEVTTGSLVLRFDNWAADPIDGTVHLGPSWTMAFTGWVQLIQAVEEARSVDGKRSKR